MTDENTTIGALPLVDKDKADRRPTNAQPQPTVPVAPPTDLPDRIVVGANGAYWRDYGDHYSMAVVSEDNDPVEILAIYNRQEAGATAWDRGFKAGLDAARASAPVSVAALAEAMQDIADHSDDPASRNIARDALDGTPALGMAARIEALQGWTIATVVEPDGDVTTGMDRSDAALGSVQHKGDWLQRGVVLASVLAALPVPDAPTAREGLDFRAHVAETFHHALCTVSHHDKPEVYRAAMGHNQPCRDKFAAIAATLPAAPTGINVERLEEALRKSPILRRFMVVSTPLIYALADEVAAEYDRLTLNHVHALAEDT